MATTGSLSAKATRPGYIQRYRLNGSLGPNLSALPEVAAGIPGVVASTGVAGDILTITGPYQSITWMWEHETVPYSQFEANDTGYVAGGGAYFDEQMTIAESNDGAQLYGNFLMQAYPGAFVEIVVIRPI